MRQLVTLSRGIPFDLDDLHCPVCKTKMHMVKMEATMSSQGVFVKAEMGCSRCHATLTCGGCPPEYEYAEYTEADNQKYGCEKTIELLDKLKEKCAEDIKETIKEFGF